MYSPTFVLLLLLLPGIWAANYSNDTIISDVAIVGGGSSGTYAAIRLQQLGYSVSVVEKQSKLGGQVNTYRDSTNNKTVDFGVLVFSNVTVVLDYLDYLNISIGPLSESPSTAAYANFSGDGKIVEIPSSIPWANESAIDAALASYAELLAYYPYLWNGFDDLPDPVPEDLLLTWGDFLDKYNLTELAYYGLNLVEGFGNILDQPAIYVMKWFGQLEVDSLLGNGVEALTTTNNDNQGIYDAALAKLGSSVFLSSNATTIERFNNSVQLSVATPSGSKLIQAKELLVAIPPLLDNLNGLGLTLSAKEQTLFSQFNNSYYWNMLIENSGIPEDVELTNVDLSLPLGIPSLPGLYGFRPSGLSGLQDALYGSPHRITDEEAKGNTLATLAKLVSANGYASNGTAQIVGFANHSPFELTVSVEAIQDGFYKNLSSLQGQHNTWWTGAAFQTQDSTQIWNWTEYTLLPQIVASL